MSRSKEQRSFRTTDLTLATFLIIEGHEPKLTKDSETKSGHPIGAWLFPQDEKLLDLVQRFNERQARVEPIRFHNMVASTRRAMFEHLGVNPGR